MILSRRFATGVAAVGVAALTLLGAVPATAATVGTTTSDFVSDNDGYYSAVSPDKSIMAVSFYNASEIWLINTATGTPTKVSDPSSDLYLPGAVVFSPDGSTLYVANYASGSGNIVVIDVATAAVTDTLTSGDITGPWTMTISPDGGTLYIGDYYGDTLVTYNLSTDVTTTRASLSYPYQMFISPDGSLVYSVDYGGEIDVFDTGSGLITETWSDLSALSPEIYGACVNSDVSVVYAVDSTNNAVYAVSTADGSILQSNTTDVVNGAYYCSVSPDDSKVFLTNEDVGEANSPDYVATTPGVIDEFNAADLSFVKSYDVSYVAYTQQMQFYSDCSAWVVGYYGRGQTFDLDNGACAKLPDTGASSSVIGTSVAVSAGLLVAGVLALILVRRRQHI